MSTDRVNYCHLTPLSFLARTAQVFPDKDALALLVCSDKLSSLESQTFNSLGEYGHLGAVDTLFGLAKTLEQGKIQPGSLVVLASSAAGFSWAALTVKYQEV